MQLRTKIILLFTVLSLLVVGAVLLFLFYFIKPGFKADAIGDIKIISEANNSLYITFTEGLKSRVRNWSSDRYVKELSETILAVDPKSKAYTRATLDFKRYFLEEKMLDDSSVLIVDLLDKNGLVVASSRTERVGILEYQEELESNAHYFSKTITAGFGEVYLKGAVFEEDEDSRPMFHATTRLFSTLLDAEGKFTPLDGVLLVHFAPLQEFSDILSKASFRQTNAQLSFAGAHKGVIIKDVETYLVDQNGRVILSVNGMGGFVDSPLIKECSPEYSEKPILEYVNTRGESVVGSISCFREDGLMLINEVPTAQIYALLNQIVIETLIVGFLVFLFVVTLLTLAGTRFVRGVEKIADLSKKVALGDFTVRAPETRKDEIGAIAHALNTILDTANTLQGDQKIANKKLAEYAEKLKKDITDHEGQEQFLEQSKRATLNLLEDTWKTKEALEIRERRLQALLAAIPNAIFLIDRDYKIEMVNPRAEKFTSFSNKELVGRDFRSVTTFWKKQREKIGQEESPIEKTFLTGVMQFTSLEDELTLTTERHPIHLPITMSVTALREDVHDGRIKAVVVIRDITHDRELDEARSGFISIASHQLRTPMTTIRWYSEMLLDEDLGSLSSTQRDFLNEIHEGSERLYKTIDLLLAISRIEGGKQKAEPQNIDLKVFTQEVLKELSPQSNAKKLIVSMIPSTREPLVVWLDPLRLRQVVTNLLTNAIRYNNEGGVLEVSWEVTKDNTQVSYSVRDTGIGVPVADQSKMFTKFFRAENALAQAPDGSGLGLPLVKDIVEEWGGQVRFSTIENKGSTFTFTMPLVTLVF
jgi:PAS domain S-box-containing protein